ncbi:MAG: hypothetical protein JWQ21_3553 [Herminiimonas sp.]|nr:hypothetical protein [Herminiimonas sp.]
MWKYFAASLASAMLINECGAAEYLANANYFGLFTTESRDGKNGCASVDSKTVTVGMPVNIVVLSKPQRILNGIVESKSSAECTRFFQSSKSAAFYDITITRGKFEPHELGVAVLSTVALTQTKAADVTAELDQESYRFHECSSNEGIHVAVRSRSGKVQTVWHDYIYLGYDVEPTCRKKDYAGIEALDKAFNRDPQMRAR